MRQKNKVNNIETEADDPLSSPEARGNRLKRLRNMANLTRERICEDGKINIHTLVGWENGRFGGLTRNGALRVVQKIAEEGVRCTVEWLLSEIGPGPIILTDYTKAVLDLQKDNRPPLDIGEEEKLIASELILFRKHNPETIDFMVEDDSMLPLFKAGDYVAGIKRYKNKIKTTVGFDCIVQTNNGQIFLRNVRNGPQQDTYTLVCSNPLTKIADPVIYDIKLASAAPVIWHRKKDQK